jgi:hypothetical protein
MVRQTQRGAAIVGSRLVDRPAGALVAWLNVSAHAARTALALDDPPTKYPPMSAGSRAVWGMAKTKRHREPPPAPDPPPFRLAGQQRLPKAEDLERILELIPMGRSLSSICAELGVHRPMANAFLRSDRWHDRYAHARAERVDFHTEQMLAIGMAATTGQKLDGHDIDAKGGRLLLDAIKWFASRCDPEGEPAQKIDLKFYEATLGAAKPIVAPYERRVLQRKTASVGPAARASVVVGQADTGRLLEGGGDIRRRVVRELGTIKEIGAGEVVIVVDAVEV